MFQINKMEIKNKQINNGPVRHNVRSTLGGFTLIELMVATSIFVVIMLASMGSLFTLLDASKTSRALRFAMDNVNFSMESMARSIRMGTNYECIAQGGSPNGSLDYTADCPASTNSNTLSFKPQDPLATNKIMYRWNTGVPSIERCSTGFASSCVSIVSPDVKIDKLQFIVAGSAPDDNKQASVYILIKGTVYVKDIPTSFSIQTLASQRNF